MENVACMCKYRNFTLAISTVVVGKKKWDREKGDKGEWLWCDCVKFVRNFIYVFNITQLKIVVIGCCDVANSFVRTGGLKFWFLLVLRVAFDITRKIHDITFLSISHVLGHHHAFSLSLSLSLFSSSKWMVLMKGDWEI